MIITIFYVGHMPFAVRVIAKVKPFRALLLFFRPFIVTYGEGDNGVFFLAFAAMKV